MILEYLAKAVRIGPTVFTYQSGKKLVFPVRRCHYLVRTADGKQYFETWKQAHDFMNGEVVK